MFRPLYKYNGYRLVKLLTGVIYSMGIHGLCDLYTLSPQTVGTHIRKSTSANVAAVTCKSAYKAL